MFSTMIHVYNVKLKIHQKSIITNCLSTVQIKIYIYSSSSLSWNRQVCRVMFITMISSRLLK